MAEIGAFEAKNKLGQLLDRVEAGEEITITRRGRPVARLVPPQHARDPEEVRRVVERIREMRVGMTLGGLSIAEMIAEGRK